MTVSSQIRDLRAVIVTLRQEIANLDEEKLEIIATINDMKSELAELEMMQEESQRRDTTP